MPEMSGLDAILAIRDEFPEARIIVLTTYPGDVQAQRTIKAGTLTTVQTGHGLKSQVMTPK
jgi:DNA-binding NarL/FixJ family response regulator